jgi:DNA-binding NtrC family response regulator
LKKTSTESNSRRLICTLGVTPAVVTEALDKYFFDSKNRRPINECVIVHTNAERVLESVKAVRASFEGGSQNGDLLQGVTYPCRVPGLTEKAFGPLSVRLVDLGFPEMLTEEQHDHFMGCLAHLIAEARQSGRPVEVCLAGGRKSESACAAIAGQLFGAERVVHVVPTGISEKEIHGGELHFPLEKYEMTQMRIIDLSPVTYRILEARGQTVRSGEDAQRILEEFTRHIPALAAREVERVYHPSAADRSISFGGIETTSGAYAEALEIAQAAATSDSYVLITGETGVGKEVLARAIHKMGPRQKAPFKHFQCGQHATTLFEAELFGVERGAHSEARATRPGPIEDAADGTLFIDEIDSLKVDQQVALLRLLQNREFERVGGRQTLRVKARLIFATNKDLDALIQEGRFRKDLQTRIRTLEIIVPPLRERKEDIPALARTLLAGYAKERGILPPELDSAALEILTIPDWTGNIRDLEQALKEWVDLGRTKGFPISQLRKCVEKRNRAAAPATDEAGNVLRRILAGELSYQDFRKAAPRAQLSNLIVRARAWYQEHVKGKGVELSAWTKKHFGVSSLDPDFTKSKTR